MQDSESLDSCIQNTLATLYPPFGATSSTVLCQVLDVVESAYRGDGLHYLISFLVPTKRVLQNLQQDACFPYCGFLFRHEGWPLCIHEKIIVQLSSLDRRVLRPGDFYLQVLASAKSPPHIALRCLSASGQHVEEVVVPELAYTSLFTMAWLDSINQERGGDGRAVLEHCLLSADNDVFRVPWEDVVHPEFISRPPNADQSAPEYSRIKDLGEALGSGVEHSCTDNTAMSGCGILTDASMGQSEEREIQSSAYRLLPAMAQSGRSSCTSEDSEGEYVELEEIELPCFSPQKGSLTQSISLTHRNLQQSWATGPVQMPPGAAPCQGPGRNSARSQSMVCTALIKENLSESLQPHVLTHSMVEELPCQPHVTRARGTASAGMHVHAREHVPEHPDHGSTARPASQTDMARSDTEALSKLQHCAVTNAVEQEKLSQVCSGSDQPTVNGDTTDPELSAAGEQRVDSEVEADSSVRNTHPDPPDPQLVTAETSRSLIPTRTCTEAQAEPQLEDPTDESPVCDCPYDGVCILGLHEGVEGGSGSARPLREKLDWAFVPTQPGESPVMADRPGQERTALPCVEKEVKGRNEAATEALVEWEESSSKEGRWMQSREQSDVLCDEDRERGIDGKRLEPGPEREVEAERVAVNAVREDETPQTGLSHSTPQSGTPSGQEEGEASIGRVEREQTQEEEKERLQEGQKERMKAEEVERTLTVSSETEECNTAACHAAESERVTTVTVVTRSVAPQSFGGVSDVPVINGDYTPERTDTHTPDTLVEGENISAVEGVVEEIKVEVTEEQKPADETTSSINGSTRPRADVESHTHHHLQPQLQKECIRAEDRALCPISVSPSVSPVCVRNQPVLSEAQNISPDVLSSGVLCLPGTRDKSGRALVTVALRNTAWLNPDCNSVALMRIMVYYYSTLRKEVQALGLTILVDARRCSPVPALFKACHILQEAKPGCIHTLLLLADRDLALRLEKPSTFQVELLSSLKALHKHVDVSQLPTEFDGTFPFCHASWLYFRTRLEQLSSDCEDAVNLLQTTISSLESRVLPSTAEGAEALLCKYKELMQCVLEDSRLVRLQQEGGAALSRLRKEETSVSLTEDYRDAIESVGGLYNHVDELVHRLVMLSNKCTQELEFVMEFKTLEEGFREVSDWIDEVGEGRLRTLGELEDSLEQLQRKQTLFRDFYTAAYEHCKSGEALLSRLERWEDVSSAELQVYEVKVRSFWVHLHDFSQRVEDTKEKINKTVRLYEFFDKAYEWALEGMRHLACISMEDCNTPEKSQGVIGCLETYRGQHPSIPDARFQEMKDLAGELRSDQGLKQWKFAWSKCQETKQMFEKKLEAALRARRSLPAGDEPRQAASSPRRHSDSSTPQQERSGSLSFSGWARERFSSISSSSSTPCSRTDLPKNPTWSPFHPEHRIPHRTCLSSHWLTRSTSSESAPTRTSCTFSPCLPSLVETKRRVLRKTQSFDATAGGEPVESRYGTCQRTLSEPARRGNTGVFIRGLEVSSTEVVDRPYSPRLAPAHGWVSMDTHREGSPAPEPRTKGSKLRHIVDEMVTTEREYVRSLRYIIEHYFPEMERRDLPQDLRGKRSVIFGNLEKLVDFHSQYFLKELESCCNHPLRVSHCFLRHQDQFGMYALYSKNKPKSDTLLASHGNTFFRNKQLELEDKMDLASYLLKPIQRMSKYALLLKDLIKEVSDTQEQEHSYLCAATEMVKFQLRHGNDLLAMDAIRDCDVNLKEQGQLVRQDEFTIWYGRKKTQRHIFLFEDLVLFSKPKRIEGGLDVYIYKHSFKTADVGMTETSGDSGLRFEIWFRRRTSKNQTYILQASTSDIKHAWTSDIARILWQQATRNKEIRMQEMVSMGVGNKPFLDIKPSDAAINDRAIDYIMKGRGARTRASIAVSLFDHSNPFKRAAVAGAGGPPSSTLLGPLNLHMYSSQTLLHGERPLISPCIEEDELENETSSQPSMTTESSGSSSHCLSGSGSSGSDSGCVSSHLPEPPCEEPSFPCDSTSLSSIASPSNQKPRFNSQYISAKAAQVIGPSTVV
ncbi:uncharacterized protein plekhg4 isoform X1 [Electrophorus electricus]|uniref:uncharacterized protein plekhg4 isoform X1 n=1 Tax=Electrophorus electricus TaxID=8005 RepID=UPI0015D06209|nr:uncharacterized protein plekhg4 isoform X1 [Electrophorus electricus]XP_026874452.2 uncharacterized protein plekhg4 isoform X1 [Electrophorus electricus]